MNKKVRITISIEDENGKTLATRENAVPYVGENPDVDAEAILSEKRELMPTFGALSNREVDKFVAYAKGQGTGMPFDAMEMGVLAAGRRDMQNGLNEILDSLKLDKPTCPDCGEEMDNNGRGKKKLLTAVGEPGKSAGQARCQRRNGQNH